LTNPHSKIDDISHILDMIVIGFKTKDSEYRLHCQTLVRFIKDNHILMTRTDYFNREDSCDEDYSITNFNVKLEQFKGDFEHKTVREVKIDDLGDLKIILENNASIEVIIDSSIDSFGYETEHWRFFEFDNKDELHFVVFDDLKIDESV